MCRAPGAAQASWTRLHQSRILIRVSAPASTPPTLSSGSLWQYGDFNRLWAGESISFVGTAVSTLVLPTLAVLQLGAGPAAVGLLLACQRISFPFLALVVGAWVDRVPRRPLMVAADLGRSLLLSLVPILDLTGHPQPFRLGSHRPFRRSAERRIRRVVPGIPSRHRRPSPLCGGQGPSRGQLRVRHARRPGVGRHPRAARRRGDGGACRRRVLCGFRTGPPFVRAKEPRTQLRDASTRLCRDIAAGALFVFGEPALRSVLITMTTLTFLMQLLEPAVVVFAYHSLRLSPGLFGIVLASSGLGVLQEPSSPLGSAGDSTMDSASAGAPPQWARSRR